MVGANQATSLRDSLVKYKRLNSADGRPLGPTDANISDEHKNEHARRFFVCARQ